MFHLRILDSSKVVLSVRGQVKFQGRVGYHSLYKQLICPPSTLLEFCPTFYRVRGGCEGIIPSGLPRGWNKWGKIMLS